MRRFQPATARFVGRLTFGGPVAGVFELFSPLGEKLWVPGWDPELLHPPGEAWAAGLIFRTLEEKGEAIWIVTRLDRPSHEVEYHRVESGRYVARVAVVCVPRGDARTEVSVTYEYVGLSDSGNAEIAAMTDAAYDDKMARWTRWVNDHLRRQGG